MATSTRPFAEYEKLKDENEKLKSQVAELSKPKVAAGLLDAAARVRA